MGVGAGIFGFTGLGGLDEVDLRLDEVPALPPPRPRRLEGPPLGAEEPLKVTSSSELESSEASLAFLVFLLADAVGGRLSLVASASVRLPAVLAVPLLEPAGVGVGLGFGGCCCCVCCSF